MILPCPFREVKTSITGHRRDPIPGETASAFAGVVIDDRAQLGEIGSNPDTKSSPKPSLAKRSPKASNILDSLILSPRVTTVGSHTACRQHWGQSFAANNHRSPPMHFPKYNGQSALSPYLRDSSRLADVIAAIQAMATYKFYNSRLRDGRTESRPTSLRLTGGKPSA